MPLILYVQGNSILILISARFSLSRVGIVVNCSIYNQPFVKKQCHGCCIESMCKTLLQSVVTFLNLYLSCSYLIFFFFIMIAFLRSCSAVQDILRPKTIVLYLEVWLGLPLHECSQDFSSQFFLFAHTYPSLNLS